jgi:hypothetical protein
MDSALLQQLQTWATIAGAVATVAAAGVVTWYTIETQKLRKAAEKQNEISGMPIIALRLSSGERGLGEPLSLELQSLWNIGNGPAFNIDVTPIQKAPFEVRFEPVPLLEPKDNQGLRYSVLQDAVTSGFSKMSVWLESVIETGQLGSEMAISVSYSDASGNRYHSDHIVHFDAAARTVTTVFKHHRKGRP